MEESKRIRVLQFVQNALQFGDRVVLPLHVDRYLMSFADEEFGENWMESADAPAILGAGLGAIAGFRTSADPPEYDLSSVMASLFGFGPLHFHKVPLLLRNLLRKWVFPNELKVLDLGAGAGIASLSLVYFFELLANAVRISTGASEEFHLRFTPLDQSDEALQIYQRLLQNYAPVYPEVRVELGGPIIAKLGPEAEALGDMLGNERFHVILASHVLGEMRTTSITKRAKLLAGLVRFLESGGSLVFVESAATSITSEMNQLKSRAVGEGISLFHPCSSAWEKPTGRQCYTCSNAEFQRLRRPLIAELLGTVCETYDFDALAEKNAWSYGIFRADEVVHHPQLEIGSGLFAKIVELPDKAGSRSSIYASVARSEAARVDGQPYFRICDQTAGSDLAYLKFNADVGSPLLENGDVLEIENASIEAASGGRNKVWVVVDAETRVRNLSHDFRHLPSKHALTPEVLG